MRSPSKRKLPYRVTTTLWGVFSLLILLAVVELAIKSGLISRHVVPQPTQIVGSFWRLFAEEGLAVRLMQTIASATIASALVFVIGLPVGYLLYARRAAGRAFEPWIAAISASPTVLAYPLFLAILGRNMATVVVFSVLAGLPPMLLKTAEGFSNVRPVFRNLGRALNLSPARQLRSIEFPAAVPTIFTGLKLGMTLCLLAVVVVEFLVGLDGLGQLVNELAERYDLAGSYAAIAFVLLISAGLLATLESIERWLRS